MAREPIAAGEHRLIHGDALDPSLIEPESVDLIVTSPLGSVRITSKQSPSYITPRSRVDGAANCSSWSADITLFSLAAPF